MKDDLWFLAANGTDPYKHNFHELRALFNEVSKAQQVRRTSLAGGDRRPRQGANSFRHRYGAFLRLSAGSTGPTTEPFAYETRFLSRVLSAYAYMRILEKKFNFADVKFNTANDYNALAARMAAWGAAIFAGEMVGIGAINDTPDGTPRDLSIGQHYANFHGCLSTSGVAWYEWAIYALYAPKGYRHSNEIVKAAVLFAVREFLNQASAGRAWLGLLDGRPQVAEKLMAERLVAPNRGTSVMAGSADLMASLGEMDTFDSIDEGSLDPSTSHFTDDAPVGVFEPIDPSKFIP